MNFDMHLHVLLLLMMMSTARRVVNRPNQDDDVFARTSTADRLYKLVNDRYIFGNLCRNSNGLSNDEVEKIRH